jgi:hypothetical protein
LDSSVLKNAVPLHLTSQGLITRFPLRHELIDAITASDEGPIASRMLGASQQGVDYRPRADGVKDFQSISAIATISIARSPLLNTRIWTRSGAVIAMPTEA